MYLLSQQNKGPSRLLHPFSPKKIAKNHESQVLHPFTPKKIAKNHESHETHNKENVVHEEVQPPTAPPVLEKGASKSVFMAIVGDIKHVPEVYLQYPLPSILNSACQNPTGAEQS